MRMAMGFYCKGCGALFFAIEASPDNLRDHAGEISWYMHNEDRLAIMDMDLVRITLQRCMCANGVQGWRKNRVTGKRI